MVRWLSANWIWLVVVGGMLWMHLGMHPRSADLTPRDTRWPEPRVAYLVYPSDPVPVFDLRTLWSPPAWTTDPKGYDIADRARWFPIITGVQTVGDLIDAYDAPPGHGHNYDLDFVGGWANVAPPDGWTDADTARLRSFLAESHQSG